MVAADKHRRPGDGTDYANPFLLLGVVIESEGSSRCVRARLLKQPMSDESYLPVELKFLSTNPFFLG